jgi:hypothetical protein
MVKYVCDNCGDDISQGDQRWIFRIEDANHKEGGKRTVCLCGVCKEVMEEHYPNIFNIGYLETRVERR